MSTIDHLIQVAFSIALFVNALLFIPQSVRIIKTKSAKDISLITFGGFLLIQLATISHAIVMQDKILTYGFLASIITCGTVVALALFYQYRDKHTPSGQEKSVENELSPHSSQ